MDNNDLSLYKTTKIMDYTDSNIMMIDRYHYTTPLSTRYSSEEMSHNFSELKKYSIYRWLWCYLAKAQKELGLPITDEMISEMQENIEDIDFDFIEEEEKVHKHDIIAHLNEFSSRCPKSGSMIHLGATSSFVGDNTDLIVLRDAFDILLPKLANCIHKLTRLSIQYKNLPTVGFTHFRPAELVTVGKRFCIWISDLLNDLQALTKLKDRLKFRGCKSTTGTQNTYLELFNGDKEKVKKLEQLVAEFAGFKSCYTIVDRKVDVDCLSTLANLGVSIHKMCTDIRLLSGLNQLEESSSSNNLVHKRNPLKSERCCSLARILFSLNTNALNTYSIQWLERTNDDSILKRSTIPDAFLTADVILNTLQSLLNNLIVHTPIINKLVIQELPFLSSFVDKISNALEKKGINTENSRLKIISLQKQADHMTKVEGKECNLSEIIKADPFFNPIKDELNELLNPNNYIGCCEEQVNDFINNEVQPLISSYGF